MYQGRQVLGITTSSSLKDFIAASVERASDALIVYMETGNRDALNLFLQYDEWVRGALDILDYRGYTKTGEDYGQLGR